MRPRKAIIFVSTITAAVLALGSTAFACTIFTGYMTVTGNGGTGTTTAYGTATGMTYCQAPNTTGGGATELQVGPNGQTNAVVTISGGSRGAIGTCTGTSALAAATDWVMTATPGKWDPPNGRTDDCMVTSGASNKQLSIGQVLSTAAGGAFGPYTSNNFAIQAGDVGICFSHVLDSTSAPQVPTTAI